MGDRTSPLGNDCYIHTLLKENYAHNPDDCVMCVKHLVNSYELAQALFTLLPSDFAKLSSYGRCYLELISIREFPLFREVGFAHIQP